MPVSSRSTATKSADAICALNASSEPQKFCFVTFPIPIDVGSAAGVVLMMTGEEKVQKEKDLDMDLDMEEDARLQRILRSATLLLIVLTPPL